MWCWVQSAYTKNTERLVGLNMSILGTVLDHYDDKGKLLRESFDDRGIPEVIKLAADLSDATEKNEEDYALVYDDGLSREYRYPLVDAGNALASAMYFSEYGGDLPAEKQKTAAIKINAALEQFGFEPTESLVKTASFELGFQGDDSTSLEALFGVGSDDAWTVVDDAFDGCSPRGKRRLVMQVKEASVLARQLAKNPEMEKYAGDSIGSDLVMALDLRARLVPGSVDSLREFSKVASAANPDEVAAALEAFDVENSLTHLYGKHIPDAYESVFGNSLEKNASTENVVNIDGRDYTGSNVAEWVTDGGESQLSSAFGEDFANQFKADPVTVLDSLPITHKQAIARMIDES